MLIDRSDELSVLFERSHALEARLKAGTIAMGQREGEVRARRAGALVRERRWCPGPAAAPLLSAVSIWNEQCPWRCGPSSSGALRPSTRAPPPRSPRRSSRCGCRCASWSARWRRRARRCRTSMGSTPRWRSSRCDGSWLLQMCVCGGGASCRVWAAVHVLPCVCAYASADHDTKYARSATPSPPRPLAPSPPCHLATLPPPRPSHPPFHTPPPLKKTTTSPPRRACTWRSATQRRCRCGWRTPPTRRATGCWAGACPTARSWSRACRWGWGRGLCVVFVCSAIFRACGGSAAGGAGPGAV